jgi:hypothetical protein
MIIWTDEKCDCSTVILVPDFNDLNRQKQSRDKEL